MQQKKEFDMEVKMNEVRLEVAFGDVLSSLVVKADGNIVRAAAELLSAKEVEVSTTCGAWCGTVRSVSVSGEKAVMTLWSPVYTGALKAYMAHTKPDSGCAILAGPEHVYSVSGSSGEAASVEEYQKLRATAPSIEDLSEETDAKLKDLDGDIVSTVESWRSSDAPDVSRHIAGQLWINDEWSTFQHRWDWAKYGQSFVSNLNEAEGVEAAQMILEALAAKIMLPDIQWTELKAYYDISQEDISSFL